MRPQRSRIFFCKPIAYIFDNYKSQNITQYSLRVKIPANAFCRYFCLVISFNIYLKPTGLMGYNEAKSKMKKVYLISIVVLITVICFSSCSKPEKQIIGKWKITEFRDDDGMWPTAEGSTWQFDDNGKFKGWLYGEVTCKYDCDGNELTIKNTEVGYVFKFDVDEISKKDLSVSGKCYDVDYDDYWPVYVELVKKK